MREGRKEVKERGKKDRKKERNKTKEKGVEESAGLKCYSAFTPKAKQIFALLS